jgi:hypothetical protein
VAGQVSLSLQQGEVAIVATHVTGYPKESYEPLWDTLLDNSRSGTSKLKIRGIRTADMAHKNANVVTNEEFLGKDYYLFYHSQDLLRLADIFGKDLPQPIIGIRHSVGTSQPLLW